MKRFFIILLVIGTFGMTTSHAQEMKKGMNLGSIGLGLVPGIGLSASYDYGLIDTWGPGIFTIGGFVGFDNYSYNSDIRATQFLFAPRATYRYAIDETFEIYGSIMLGGRFVSYSQIKANTSNAYLAVTAGCRYAFTHNLSGFAEVGYNISFLNLGLSVSF